MTFELLLAFNIALLASIASPGPALLMSIRTSLVKGKRAGILVGLGLATVASMWTLAALLGLDAIFRIFPWAYVIVKTVGALYLLYIAWNTWKDAKKPISEKGRQVKSRPYVEGMLINLSNPKAVLFAAAVLVVIFPPDLAIAESLFIAFNHFLLEVICYTTIAFVMNTRAISDAYLSMKHWFDRFAAVVLAGLGLRLLVQK